MKDSQWKKTMLKKYGSEEAVSAKMKENSSKSDHSKNIGGFGYMKQHDPERLKEISKKGGGAPRARN